MSPSSSSVRVTCRSWLATLVAFFVGYAVIAWLIRYVSHGSFLPFVIYRVALGLLLFVLLGTGVIAA